MYDGKIHIFGGRFSSDLNDLLILDIDKNEIKAVKTSIEVPKARRRHSSCFVGSCMVIFGGFNGEYYNDLYYINVFELRSRLAIPPSPRTKNITKMINNDMLADRSIKMKDGGRYYLNRGLIVGNF